MFFTLYNYKQCHLQEGVSSCCSYNCLQTYPEWLQKCEFNKCTYGSSHDQNLIPPSTYTCSHSVALPPLRVFAKFLQKQVQWEPYLDHNKPTVSAVYRMSFDHLRRMRQGSASAQCADCVYITRLTVYVATLPPLPETWINTSQGIFACNKKIV